MFGQRLAFVSAAVLIAAGAFTARRAVSATVLKEAESFSNCYNTANDPIQISSELTCSGGQMIIGLDHYGEWVEYPVTVSVEGNYTAHMHCRGDLGLSYWFELTLTPAGGGLVQVYSINFKGKGYG